MKFHIAGIGNFAWKILKFSVRTAQVIQIMPKHIFWSIIDSSSLYAAGVTRIQGVVLRRIGSVVTSGHATKMAVTSFDPQLPKSPCYTQT